MSARTLARTSSTDVAIPEQGTPDATAALAIATAAIVRMGIAAGTAADAYRDAGAAFIASARATRDALASGVSAVKLAAAVAARVAEGEVPASLVYTSDPAIGFHALTGDYLALPGAAKLTTPDGRALPVAPQDVQTIVKAVGQRNARAIIAKATDQDGAYRALVKAAKERKAAKDKAAKAAKDGGEDGGENGAAVKATQSTSALIHKAQDILSGARAQGVETTGDVEALRSLSVWLTEWVKSDEVKAVLTAAKDAAKDGAKDGAAKGKTAA